MTSLLRLLVALLCGATFSFGLAISGMLDPTRVRGFLDVFGAWDPSLVFVLAGAVVTSFIGVRLSRRIPAPLLATAYDLPKADRIDVNLVAGAAIFGIGWGLSGLCPGPAVADIDLGVAPIAAFIVAMIVGMLLHRMMRGGTRQGQPRAALVAEPSSSTLA